jgi:hypothetical protein
MTQDKKIKDIIRQEKRLEKQAEQLLQKRSLLDQEQQRLYHRRWTLAVRRLVGKQVKLIGDFHEPELIPLNGRVGTLRKVHRSGKCEVDFADLGIHTLGVRDIMASDGDEWTRIFNGD